MEFEEQRRLEEHFRGLAEADLRRLTTLDRSQYRDEAFRMAMEELGRRRLPALLPEEYWSQFPEEWMAQVGFCHTCWTTTTDESPGPVGFFRIGTRLMGYEDPCSVCQSVVRTKWFCFLVVPLVRLAKYRVLPDPIKGRRLRDNVEASQRA